MSTIRKLPNGRFRAEIRKNYKFIKNKTFSTKKEAESWAQKIEKSINEILSIKPKKYNKLTPEKIQKLGGLELFEKLGIKITIRSFAQVADEYMLQWKGKDPNQVIRVAFWGNIFGQEALTSIKKDHVKSAINDYAKGKCKIGNGPGQSRVTNKPRSGATVKRMAAVLSAIFKYAKQQDYVKKNPVLDIYIEAEGNKIERFLSDAERERLITACLSSNWDKMYLLFLLAITTGARRSELLGLNWSDINFEHSTALLKETKNGSRRTLTFPTVAMTELRKHHKQDNGLIFPSHTNADRPMEFRYHWEKALKQANVHNFRWHDLRHSAASYLAMAGASLHEIGQVLGHKSVQTTQRYAHLSTQHQAALTERTLGSLMI
jgi:integrase